jgi:hypothetical protein
MKTTSVLIALLFSLCGCAQNDLTSAETALAKSLNFDSSIFTELKAATGKEAKQLPAIDEETGEVDDSKKFNGIYFESSEGEAEGIAKKLKSKLREQGYLVFGFDDGASGVSVAVIKGTDELDILRYRRTDGINYDFDNADVVKKIAEWHKKYGVSIIGCGRDTAQIEFAKLPANLTQFSKEVYKFCPDVVEQGVGDIEALPAAIEEANGITLWWD